MNILAAFLCALATLVAGATIAAAIILLIVYVSPWVALGALVLIALGLMTAGNYLAGRDGL